MTELEMLRNKLEVDGELSESVESAVDEIEKQLALFHALEETLFNSELYLVYLHVTPDGKKYFGITKNLPTTRWNEGSGYESQKRFYKAIQKFGWINIEHQIVAAGLTEEAAKAIESSLIKQYNTCDARFGYNQMLSTTETTITEQIPLIRPKKDQSNQKQDLHIDVNPPISKKSDIDVCNQIIEKYS